LEPIHDILYCYALILQQAGQIAVLNPQNDELVGQLLHKQVEEQGSWFKQNSCNSYYPPSSDGLALASVLPVYVAHRVRTGRAHGTEQLLRASHIRRFLFMLHTRVDKRKDCLDAAHMANVESKVKSNKYHNLLKRLTKLESAIMALLWHIKVSFTSNQPEQNLHPIFSEMRNKIIK